METKDFKIGYIADVESSNLNFPMLTVFSNNPTAISEIKDMLTNYSGVNLGGGYEEDDFAIKSMKRIKYIEEE